MKRFLTTMAAVLIAVLLCCSAAFAAGAAEPDPEAMREALGLTEEEWMALMEGSLDFNDVDLSDIDVGALVEAAGMSEDEIIREFADGIGVEEDALSGIELSEIDVGALVEAAGLTGDDLNQLVKGELDPTELDLASVDVPAAMDALGLSMGDVALIALPLLLESAGLGGLDWRGLFISIGKGASIGAIAGVVVVILIIVLLAVTGRKKRAKA